MKEKSLSGINGMKYFMKAAVNRRMILGVIFIILLSVAVTAIVWGQQGGQPGAAVGSGPGGAGGPGGMPGAQGGPSGMPGGGMPAGMPGGGEKNITPAIYIDDGRYVKDKSITKAITGGKVENESASGVKILSKEEKFNGVYVKGSKSQYTLTDAVIDLYGNGLNHVEVCGAGAVADGGATLTLKNAKITTNGVVSCTAVASDGGILKVYDSTLIANGGTYPKDAPPQGTGPDAYGPPLALGITGTTRACLVENNGKGYFYNSTIISENWGALSTDGMVGYLEANNCNVIVRKSGYGTYADGSCKVVINDSKMDTATFTGIIAAPGQIYLNNVEVTSGGSCGMIHCIAAATDIAKMEVRGGKITTEKAVFLIKSACADIVIEGAELLSKSGILIQSIINDDKDAAKVKGQKVPGIKATLKKMDLDGNIIHDDPDRSMSVTFNDVILKGAIKNASISLDAGSKWTASADSKVTLLGNIDVEKIDAIKGVIITAMAGEGCTLKGLYSLAGGGTLKIKAD